jgi:P-type Ca2+ transporter type 2C
VARQSAPRLSSERTRWHTLAVERLWSDLGTSAGGLSDGEAAKRLEEAGPNRLPPAAGVSALTILLAQLRSIVVLLLVAAVIISVILGDLIEAGAIGAVLVINTALGFVTEWRARRAMEALLQLQATRVAVLRNGQLRVVDAETLVPGDVVQLDPGNTVPGDVRLFHCVEFTTNEAALTGESLPVSKTPDLISDEQVPLADRRNMAYMGTTIATGTALGVVVATGVVTELGRIGELVKSVEEEPTPLERRLDALGRRLAWITIVVAAMVALIDLLHGEPVGVVLNTAIALAVAAIPEALPAVATIALAVGMQRMARRHALVRRLPSVEALGATTVVCTDKTRTLTSGDMEVVRMWTASRESKFSPSDQPVPADPALRRLIEIAALASQEQPDADEASRETVGNPVDIAVLNLLRRTGGDRAALLADRPIRGMLPFSSARKLMASFHSVEGVLVAFVKGAPSRILARSSSLLTPDGPRPLDDRERDRLSAMNEQYARSGLRVLAVASGDVTGASEQALQDLVFEGYVCLADPVAAGVTTTIARLRTAGLRTVMITGDQRATAEAVGREIGLLDEGGEVMDGRQLDALPPPQLPREIGPVTIFSRVSPEHKLVIVSALQQRGEIVAMLGDGVNDAAALKKADVGVAMGIRGTDVAKQASAIVLQNDRFETVAAAVEEGRIIFDNIRKFVFYLFSCNVAEVLVLLIAGVAGLPLPLQPLQLLWLNMVTDTFPALALAMEPGDSTVMTRPPRDPNEAILSRPFLTSIFGYAAAITLSTLAAFGWGVLTVPDRAPTMAFMTLGITQIAHLGNARSDADVLSPARALANRYALAGVAIALALQLATSFGPLASILGVRNLTVGQWGVVFLCAAIPAVGGQVYKRGLTGRPNRS